MLKAYLDRGARPDADGVMCVAAALFKRPKYKQFVRDWNRMLKDIKPGGVPYFHATDFFPGGGLFIDVPNARRNEIAASLPAIIDKHVHHVVAASFKADEFHTVAPLAWRQQFGSLHAVAVQMCIGAVGHWANERKYNGPVDYILESGDADETDVGNRLHGISINPVLKHHARYRSHSFKPKGRARGLEVADYFAWHWNKFDAETLSRDPAYAEHREMRKDLQALVLGNQTKYRVFRFTEAPLAEFLISHGCHRKDEAV